MPSQPEETIDHDLGNILQLVRLARASDTTPHELDTFLAHIEARATAARAKLAPPAPAYRPPPPPPVSPELSRARHEAYGRDVKGGG